MEQQRNYFVLDPTQSPEGTDNKGSLAPRLSTLDGQILAVVNNGKMNSDVFLHSLVDLVKQQYNLKDIIWIDKTNVSLPVTDEMLEKLKGSNAVISGIGD